VTWQAAARAIWRYKWLAAALTALLVVLTGILVSRQPKEYQASSKLELHSLVTPSTSNGPNIDTDKQLPDAYSAIVSGSAFARLAAANLVGTVPNITAAEVKSDISASPVNGTAVLTVTARGRDPQRVANIANVATISLRQFIKQSQVPVAVTLVDAATVPTSPVSPRVTLALAIALVVGLIVNSVLMVLLDLFRDRFADPEELERLTGKPVLATVPRLGRARLASRLPATPRPRAGDRVSAGREEGDW
jgi:capsular polysaccharide biosynthesis protein